MTAVEVMRAAKLGSDTKVLIIGATGGVGLLLCQLASRAGAYVVATAKPVDEKLVLSNGARETVDYTNGEPASILKTRHPGGVEVVIDLVNRGTALIAGACAIRPGGRQFRRSRDRTLPVFQAMSTFITYVCLQNQVILKNSLALLPLAPCVPM